MSVSIIDEAIALHIKNINDTCNGISGYKADDILKWSNELLNNGQVNVGYRQCAGGTHSTQKVYRHWMKLVKQLKKYYKISESPIEHKNAYATSNGGFYNETFFFITK